MKRGIIVGCGFFGHIQMKAWQRIPIAQMTAAVDLDRTKAESFASDFGIRAYTNVAEAIAAEKPDFVDIATRPSTHLALTKQAVDAGLPVLLQKPMAETFEEAREIASVASQPGVRVMINENWRWQRWYREIQSLLQAGRIGDPFYYSIQTRNNDGLGPAPYSHQPYFKDMPRLLVFEAMVHHLDTARFLFGPIEEVYCRTRKINPIIAAEDMAIASTCHESGLAGVVDGNRAGLPDEQGPAMEISRFEGTEGVIRLLHSGDVLLNGERVFEGGPVPGYRGDSCRGTQQHFVECIESGAQFETEAADYLAKTFSVVESCYLSAAENRPVRISEFADRI